MNARPNALPAPSSLVPLAPSSLALLAASFSSSHPGAISPKLTSCVLESEARIGGEHELGGLSGDLDLGVSCEGWEEDGAEARVAEEETKARRDWGKVLGWW